MQDPYEVLGVAHTATQKEIKRAFHKLAVENHPDCAAVHEKKSSLEKMQKINAAYGLIGDEKSRAQYEAKNRGVFKNEHKRRKAETKDDFNYSGSFNKKKTNFQSQEFLDSLKNINFNSELFQGNNFKRKFETLFRNEELKNKFSKTANDVDVMQFLRRCGFSPFKNKKQPLVFRVKVSLNDIFLGTKRTIKIRRNYFLVPQDSIVEVVIKPGTPYGHVIKYFDVGEVDLESSQDLHVVIEEEKDDFFHRKDEHLFCSILIRIADIFTDFKIPLKLPGDRFIELKRSDFIRIGENTLIPFLGMPVFGDPLRKGNLYVKLVVNLDKIDSFD